MKENKIKDKIKNKLTKLRGGRGKFRVKLTCIDTK